MRALSPQQFSYDDVVAAGNDPFPEEKFGYSGVYAKVRVSQSSLNPEHGMHEYKKLDEEDNAGEPYEQEYVMQMVRHLRSGGQLPPVLIHSAEGVADGGHRLLAHRLAGRKFIEGFVPVERAT